MQPNNHLMILENLRALSAQKTDMNLPSHQATQGNFQQIAERLVEADAMETRLDELEKPEGDSNIVELKPPPE